MEQIRKSALILIPKIQEKLITREKVGIKYSFNFTLYLNWALERSNDTFTCSLCEKKLELDEDARESANRLEGFEND